MQLWPWVKSKVIWLIILTFSRTIFTANLMGIAWTASEIIEHLLFLWSVWWMKVKVNIINVWCMLMSEAVTMPILTMTLILSEESLARDTHTHIHAHALTHSHVHMHTHTHTYTHTFATSILNFIFKKRTRCNDYLMCCFDGEWAVWGVVLAGRTLWGAGGSAGCGSTGDGVWRKQITSG